MATVTDYIKIGFNDIIINVIAGEEYVTDWFYVDYSKVPEGFVPYGYEINFGSYGDVPENTTVTSETTSGSQSTLAVSDGWNSFWRNSEIVKFRITANETTDKSFSFKFVSVYVYFERDSEDIPIITIKSFDRSKISNELGLNRCTAIFNSNITLSTWEARATLNNVTPGKGVGLLVESGDKLYPYDDQEIYIDAEELTNGDNEYTISVYGQSTNGVWSV